MSSFTPSTFVHPLIETSIHCTTVFGKSNSGKAAESSACRASSASWPPLQMMPAFATG